MPGAGAGVGAGAGAGAGAGTGAGAAAVVSLPPPPPQAASESAPSRVSALRRSMSFMRLIVEARKRNGRLVGRPFRLAYRCFSRSTAP
ncbi:MAG: hypothetical protein E6Q93_21695 [Burkholderiaceae bacterium]|nr:MAG: hypothetical protein E6Q93_21695 [Burkholderiaceae bacterium]